MQLASSTLEVLRQYVPVGPLEANHLARMIDLANTGSSAFSRENYTPGHFTASAFVISPGRDRVLLILHSKLHLWLQPGGHVDPNDDSLVTASRRELLEETGLTNVTLVQASPIDLDVHVIPARVEMPSHEHFDVRFLFQTNDAAYRAGSDALDAKWLPIAALTTTSTDESVRRAVQKIAARTY
jgi:8-oxo-dGTP pyrophosphatase MutT (NUDIX family)